MTFLLPLSQLHYVSIRNNSITIKMQRELRTGLYDMQNSVMAISHQCKLGLVKATAIMFERISVSGKFYMSVRSAFFHNYSAPKMSKTAAYWRIQ